MPFGLSRRSAQELREKWKKWWPCYEFVDDGLGFCWRCNRESYAHEFETFSQERERLLFVKREVIQKLMRDILNGSESTDLFAEPVDVPVAIGWFLRWMRF